MVSVKKDTGLDGEPTGRQRHAEVGSLRMPDQKGIKLSGPPLKVYTNIEKVGVDKGLSRLLGPKKGTQKCSNRKQRERISATNVTPLQISIIPQPKSQQEGPKSPQRKPRCQWTNGLSL